MFCLEAEQRGIVCFFFLSAANTQTLHTAGDEREWLFPPPNGVETRRAAARCGAAEY